MKNLKLITTTVVLITLLASCESAKQDLSNPTSRNEIMTAIAKDPTMSNEMMTAMMNGPNGKMMMQGNQHMRMMLTDTSMMAGMMKNDPEMMQRMMSSMMACAKGDTSMMSEMYKTMMGNPHMMDMMHKMNGQNMNSQGMNMQNMKGMKGN